MKSLQQLINEKLKVSKTNKKIIAVKDDKELKEIINDRLKKDSTYIDLSDIDVSKVNTFERLFEHKNIEHINLSGWDTSNGKLFIYMFAHCIKLKTIEGLDDFNMSNATDISGMFNNCFSLENIGDQLLNWDVSNINRFDYAFFSCNKLKDFSFLKNWNMSNAKVIEAMFAYTKIDSTEYVNNWDVSNLTDCSHLFSKCHNIKNADLTGWKNASNILNAAAMFKDCENLTSLNMANMKISPANINFICDDCKALEKIDMSGWDMSKLKSMNYAFRDCENLKEITGIESFDFKNLLQAAYSFEGCKSLVADLSKWVLRHHTSITKMFYKASKKIVKPTKFV